MKSEKEEIDKKNFLLSQINNEKADMMKQIHEQLDLNENVEKLETFETIDEEQERLGEFNEDKKELEIQKKKHKSEMMINRKYQAIKKAIEEDQFLFDDENFKI